MARLRIEVVYALPGRQEIVALELNAGAVAGDAVHASGLLASLGLTAAPLRLGLGGAVIGPDRRLREGDRIEILRPLTLDPKERRRIDARARRKR